MKSARKSARAKRVAVVGDVAILVVSKDLADLLERGDVSALSMGTGKGGARASSVKNGRAKNGVKVAKVTKNGVKAAKAPKVDVKPEKPEKKLTAAKMRCRHTDADGTRCRNRSKGPRFHYLCDDHREGAGNADDDDKPAVVETAEDVTDDDADENIAQAS